MGWDLPLDEPFWDSVLNIPGGFLGFLAGVASSIPTSCWSYKSDSYYGLIDSWALVVLVLVSNLMARNHKASPRAVLETWFEGPGLPFMFQQRFTKHHHDNSSLDLRHGEALLTVQRSQDPPDE